MLAQRRVEDPRPSRTDAFLESIFVAAVDGLVLFGADGHVLRMNPAAREMLADRSDEALSVTELLRRVRMTDVEGKLVGYDQLPVFAALRGETVRGLPLAFLHRDGSKLWATVGAAPIRDADGAIVGAVLSLGDVSRLRALQELREDLSRMIAHDLRAPLAVILGHAKLLTRRAEGADVLRERADAIVTNAQRMASMLNDLVESALLDAGKLRLDRCSVDVASLVGELCTRLAPPADAGRIQLEVAEDVGPVLADPDRIERVLVNLLTNALKYSAPGTEVTVRVGREDDHLIVDVQDRGQGIAPEDVPHLFERFFRSAGSFRLEGMGLGLYTARMLTEAHGGTLSVSTVRGQGSVFRLRLPALS